MSKRNMYEIDGEKLKKIIQKTHCPITELSVRLGVGKNAIGTWINRDSIPGYGVKLLESELGIPFELYTKKQPTPEKTVELADTQKILNAIGILDSHMLLIYEELTRLNNELIGEKQKEENQ